MGEIRIKNIVIIGSGNVATALAITLVNAGYHIQQIYGRSEKMAKCLASKFNVPFTTDLKSIDNNADLYIVSIIDDALPGIISEIDIRNKLIVHTSGTTDINVFKDRFDNYGVFYPLQTFSKDKTIEFDNIPICIEASEKNNEEQLISLARSISNKVEIVNSEQRRLLHVAAVFACNFTNYFYSISSDLLNDFNLDFDLLKPLIKETSDKIININPDKAQTGPAKRGDHNIISQHMDILKKYPEYEEIYKLLTQKILNRHQ